jgi:hypothetical protein
MQLTAVEHFPLNLLAGFQADGFGQCVRHVMEKVPDRKAEENLRMHLGWKYAPDLEIAYEGFDHSSLCQFRARLLEGGAQRIGFDAIVGGLREAGLVRKRSKQRLDSTHVLGAVARMSRLEVVRETLRLFLLRVEQSGRSEELRKRKSRPNGLSPS